MHSIDQISGSGIGRGQLTGRLGEIRRDLSGEDGLEEFARGLGLPARTWQNYELGVAVPGDTILKFIVTHGVDPRWLLSGEGEKYDRRDGIHKANLAR